MFGIERTLMWIMHQSASRAPRADQQLKRRSRCDNYEYVNRTKKSVVINNSVLRFCFKIYEQIDEGKLARAQKKNIILSWITFLLE